MKPRFNDSRLYNQIVYPLLVASVAVGIAATLIAVYFLGDLTSQWARQSAEDARSLIERRYERHVHQMQEMVAAIAGSPSLREAMRSGDRQHIERQLEAESRSMGEMGLLLLDSDARVVATAGPPLTRAGQRPFGELVSVGSTGSDLVSLSGVGVLLTWDRLDERGTAPHALVSYHIVDSRFLSELGVGRQAAACLYTGDSEVIASSFGEDLTAQEIDSLKTSMGGWSYDAEGLEEANAERSLEAAGVAFEVSSGALVPQGSVRPHGFVAGVVSERSIQAVGKTTVNLLTMWSVVAVVSLVGLGGWIAHRVSDPLVALSEGARRISEGDFDTRVKVRGATEVIELAETFNQMTESLRDRSDSLTKKVLELATLYDMSRDLGSTLDLDELLKSVLDSALRIFDVDLGYVALRDEERQVTVIRAVRGIGSPEVDPSVRSSMSEWVVREGRPLIFNPDVGATAQVDTVTGAKAALCVPLTSPDGASGSITIGSSEAGYRFSSDDVRLLSTIANHATIAIGNIDLFMSLQEAYLATVRSLAAAVDAKDTYTRGHSERVATYSIRIAERLSLSQEQRVALEMAAYLHDIGKIGVREDILLKPGRLDDDEMTQMRHHPLIGANILTPVAFPWAITPVVRHHHESWDGSGYPAGLRGEEIPLLARILTVADSFEAMTADRPYRRGRCTTDAIEELRRCAGTQFDSRIVDVFCELMEELDISEDDYKSEAEHKVLPEEVRKMFSALIEGVFHSFRKLGGSRLASNIESELDQYFRNERLPYRLSRGHVSFTDEGGAVSGHELEQMRMALRRADMLMARVSGPTLVEHFYIDALAGFSERTRLLACELGFYEGSEGTRRSRAV